MVRGVAFLTRGGSRLSQWLDESVVNVGFDQGCERLRHLGHFLARFQDGQIQRYLRVIGVALAVLLLLLLWGCGQ
jgi:hypothetical protein